MLQALRERASSWIIRTVLVLVALVFVFWGTSSIFSLWIDPEAIAEVNGEIISVFYYQNAINNERERRQSEQTIGEELGGGDERKLHREVLSQLINRTLVRQVAIKDKITLSPRQIDQIIVNQVSFHHEGKFNERRYLDSLRQSGFTPQNYKEYLREGFQYDAYLAAMEDAAFYTPAMLDKYVDWQYHTRNYDYLQLSPSLFVKENSTVTDEQLRNFYEENVDHYYEPEYFRIRSVTITPEDALARISYKEEDIQATYNEIYGHLYDNQEITLRHLFFEDALQSDQTLIAKAHELKERITTTEDFIRLVANYSEDQATKDRGGTLGTNLARELPSEFVEAIRIAPNNVSLVGPVRSSFGVHLLWIDNRTIVDVPRLEEIYDDLLSDYLYSHVDEQLLTLGEALSDELFLSADLLNAANKTDLPVEESELWSLNSAELRDLGRDFLDELLIMDVGEISSILWLESGNLFAFELVENIPSRLIPYDEIIERITMDYHLAQAEDELGLMMQKMVEVLNEDQSPAAHNLVVKDAGVEWREGGNVSHSDFQQNEIGSYVLSLSVSSLPYPAYTQLTTGDYVLVLLKGLTHQTYSGLESSQRQIVEENYVMEIRSNAQRWLLTNLNEQADIEINTEVWDSL